MTPDVHFRSVKGALAKMYLAVIFVTWIVTGDTLVSYWLIFSMSLVILLEVFVKDNLVQFPLVSKVANNTLLDLHNSLDDTKTSFNNIVLLFIQNNL